MNAPAKPTYAVTALSRLVRAIEDAEPVLEHIEIELRRMHKATLQRADAEVHLINMLRLARGRLNAERLLALDELRLATRGLDAEAAR